MAGDIRLTIDQRGFGRIVRDIRAFDKTLATATRKRLRDAVKPAVQDVKAEIGSGPSFQSGLAAGVRASITTGRKAGVRIVASGSQLPEAKQPMVKAWDSNTFRHPTFGHDPWKTQSGHPYFAKVITRRLPQMRTAIEQALSDALKQIGHG